MSESSLLDPLFDRVPELQDWWREAKELDLGLTSQTVDLANEILDRPTVRDEPATPQDLAGARAPSSRSR